MKATGSSTWTGTWKDGTGTISIPQGSTTFPFSFVSRFEGQPGGSTESLLAAALAGCFNQALANTLVINGFTAESIDTEAVVELLYEPGGVKPSIGGIGLKCRAKVGGLGKEKFEHCAEAARKGCVIAGLLKVDIGMEAELVKG